MFLAIIVFMGVFLLTALLITASGVGAVEREKRILSRLDAILAVGSKPQADDPLLDIRKQELLSNIPLLNRLLLRVEIAPKLRRLLYQAKVTWTPGGLLLIATTCWVVALHLIYMRTGSFSAGVILGLVPGAAPFVYVMNKRTKRFMKFEEALPSALDLIVTAIRGGNSLVSALGLVAREVGEPIGPEFRICFDEQNYGLELRTALHNLAIRVPIQDVRIVTTAILIQKETGGNLAEVLDRCAHVVRERFRLRREIRVRTAQGRLSGLVLTCLPIILGTLLYLLHPEVISLLWTRPIGLKMLYTASAMVAFGAYIIRKIVRIRV